MPMTLGQIDMGLEFVRRAPLSNGGNGESAFLCYIGDFVYSVLGTVKVA